MLKASAILLLVLLAFGQCTSLERHVTVAPSDKVVVSYRQRATRGQHETDLQALSQTLASMPDVDKVEFYSARTTDPFTKFISAEAMQLLLDAFATGGFFEQATDRPNPRNSSELTVDVNGIALTFGRSASLTPEQHRQFTLCWTAFQDLYNATKAYRTGVGTDSVIQKHAEQMRRRGVQR